MSRWIDADALMAELQKDADAFDDEADDARKNSQNYTDGDLHSVMGRADGIRDAMMEVYDAPSIDIEPKRGEWIRSSDIDIAWGSKVYTCSNCGHKRNSKTNFCPHCGADMREREGE